MSDEQLRELGLKVTLPRLKILQILEQAEEHHLSAEDVYTQLRKDKQDVGLATVYRVLTQFEAAGLVHRHNFEGGYSVFELAQEEHHDHIVCNVCGKVTEFLDPIIEKRQLEVSLSKGYKLTDHSLVIYGVCQRCQ